VSAVNERPTLGRILPDAMLHKAPAWDPLWNARVQRARDDSTCTCGHLCVSHGYGDDDSHAWPDGSLIGRGPCGAEGCECERFSA
jgi:hypothetical protein